MAGPTASELYASGDLQGAVGAATDRVKRHPTDQNARGFLAELLCITGDLERADKQLDVLSNQAPAAAPGIALFRQLVRAEMARQEFYSEGRIPEFLNEPGDLLKRHLEASILLREGQVEQAGKVLAAAEEARLPTPVTSGGVAFDDFRDLDDLTACFFEVLTTTGKYYWVPIDQVDSIEFHPPERSRDLLWRRARMVVRGGPDGEVFIPAVYVDPGRTASDRARLGRLTEWSGEDGEPVRGVGQRTFLVGEEARPIMELETLEFASEV